MGSIQAFIQAAFAINNIWWLLIKSAIWFITAIIILVKTDNPKPEKAFKDLKSTLGFFLMFIMLSGGLIYLLFGQAPV